MVLALASFLRRRISPRLPASTSAGVTSHEGLGLVSAFFGLLGSGGARLSRMTGAEAMPYPGGLA